MLPYSDVSCSIHSYFLFPTSSKSMFWEKPRENVQVITLFGRLYFVSEN